MTKNGIISMEDASATIYEKIEKLKNEPSILSLFMAICSILSTSIGIFYLKKSSHHFYRAIHVLLYFICEMKRIQSLFSCLFSGLQFGPCNFTFYHPKMNHLAENGLFGNHEALKCIKMYFSFTSLLSKLEMKLFYSRL